MKNKNIKIFPIIDNIDDYANGHGCGNGYCFSRGNGYGNGYVLLYINSEGNGNTNIIYIDKNGNKQY